jgi:hypothetical protein
MNSQTHHESSYKIMPLTQFHSAQHTTHTPLQGKPVHTLTYLIAYLFAFYIYSLHLLIYILKKYLSIADMLPHHHITYNFTECYNFSQAQYKLPDDGQTLKHVGAIFM